MEHFQWMRVLSAHRIRQTIRHLLVVASIAILSYFCALLLRFEGDPNQFPSDAALLVPFYLAFGSRLILHFLMGFDRKATHTTSLSDLFQLAFLHALSLIFVSSSILMLRTPWVSRSVLILDCILSFLGMAAVRVLARKRFEWKHQRSLNAQGNDQGIVICGAGFSGGLLLRNLAAHREMGLSPVGLLDDDPRLQGTSLHGVRVVGTLRDLESLLESRNDVRLVVLAIPSLSPTRAKEIERICLKHQVRCRSLGNMEEETLERLVGTHSSISLEEILGKNETREVDEQVQRSFTQQTVLVTGGAGSIGSELCDQLVRLPIRKLIVLDNSEYNVYRSELRLISQKPQMDLVFEIVDVRDRASIRACIAKHSPDTIIHAAAYKHVPLMERFPRESFLTNVIGTRNVAAEAHAHGVKRFVLISTDKAVRPCNVMGRCKRFAELIVQEISQRTSDHGPLKYISVRFGNVLNSLGSVIPTFREQILAGGPITVTHPDVERYFMSLHQAVRLVLTAAAYAENGQVFALEMGQKLKVREVAEKLRLLLDRPNVEIVFTGLRAGERLTEELSSLTEEVSHTAAPGLLVLRKRQYIQGAEHAAERLECQAGNPDPVLWSSTISSALEQLERERIEPKASQPTRNNA